MGAEILSESHSSLGVDPGLAERALKALLKHHAAGGNDNSSSGKQLFENELDVQVQLTLARIPGNTSPKPIRVEIPHPLVKVATADDGMELDDNLEDADVCIIVKEESKPWVQEMVERFPNELGCVKKVLGLQSLRTKHKSFTQRRDLLARFDVFLADDRILPMLTKALGGKFFEKKKQPVPIQLTRKEALPFAVQRCLRSTFMHISAGTCVTIKAGTTSMTADKLLANIQAIVSIAPTKVPRKWQNIRSISIKTSSSTALPIYNKTPEELAEIMYLARKEPPEEKETVVDKEASALEKKKKRKEMASTSPLARALKKQKDAELEDNTKKEKSSESKSKKAKVEKSKGSGESANNEEEKQSVKEVDETAENISDKKQKKKKKKSKHKEPENAGDDADPAEVVEEKSVKVEKEDKDSKSKSSKKKRKEKGDSDVAHEEKKSKKASKESAEKSETNENASFIPSKKYIGSKKGFVFRKDKQGVGYYRDVIPVVDKAWIQGLAARGRGGGKRGNRHTPKHRKGRR